MQSADRQPVGLVNLAALRGLERSTTRIRVEVRPRSSLEGPDGRLPTFWRDVTEVAGRSDREQLLDDVGDLPKDWPSHDESRH